MDFFLKIFEISPVSLIHKAQKIGIVLLILLTCQMIMRVILILNRWLVALRWGRSNTSSSGGTSPSRSTS